MNTMYPKHDEDIMNKLARLCLLALIFGIIPHSCMATDDDERRPPEHFCPISLTVMQDPVVAADGFSYEREAITRHFANSRRSAMTGADLEHTALIPNIPLRNIIRDWRPVEEENPAPHISDRVERPLPENESDYREFCQLCLVYETGYSTITLPFLGLDQTFDLSGCGSASRYLSISTGYRRIVNPANSDKLEIWIAPRFLIERELNTTAKHFQAIFTEDEWPSSNKIGVFWTWGGWGSLMGGGEEWYDYFSDSYPGSRLSLIEMSTHRKEHRTGFYYAGNAAKAVFRFFAALATPGEDWEKILTPFRNSLKRSSNFYILGAVASQTE